MRAKLQFAAMGERTAGDLGAPIDAPHLPLVESVRGLAALFVFFVHLEQFTGAPGWGPINEVFELGRGGVALFFALSGFLLYRPFVAHRLGTRSAVPLKRYTRNRLLRIYPPYLVALGVFALLGWISMEPEWIWAHVLLVHIYLPPDAGGGLGLSWSLATEVSFYLFLPLYAWVMGRVLRGRGRALRAELAILAVAALISMPVDRWLKGIESVGLAKSLPGTFYFFAVGLGLAVLSLSPEADAVALRTWIVRQRRLLWGLAALLIAGAAIHGDLQLGSVHPFHGVVSALIFAPIALQPQSRWAAFRILSSAPARWLGLLSYSLYLYHLWILIEIDKATDLPGLPMLVVCLAASLAAAWLSFWLVERPFLRRKQRITARGVTPEPVPA
jgi:peptidoglycan/LPS O-acetylase OafA/YrhL